MAAIIAGPAAAAKALWRAPWHPKCASKARALDNPGGCDRPAPVLDRSVFLFAIAGACLASTAVPAAAQRANPDDPYRYDLRVGLFPLAFSAGVSQSSFGSAVRAEVDVSRRLMLQLSGQLPWLEVAGQKEPSGFALRAGLVVHLRDEVELSDLEGTVIPQDAALPSQRKVGTDRDSDSQVPLPISERLGSPRMYPPDRREGKAPVRHVDSLRVGYDLTRAIERARPPLRGGDARYELNTFHALYLGYGFGAHWNLSPATAGERDAGWRRFYFDLTLTLEPLVDAERLDRDGRPIEGAEAQADAGLPAATSFMPVGLRIGMEGAIGALLRSAPGVGFGYNLELGALPGYSGLEGYLLVSLGLALDFSTRY